MATKKASGMENESKSTTIVSRSKKIISSSSITTSEKLEELSTISSSSKSSTMKKTIKAAESLTSSSATAIATATATGTSTTSTMSTTATSNKIMIKNHNGNNCNQISENNLISEQNNSTAAAAITTEIKKSKEGSTVGKKKSKKSKKSESEKENISVRSSFSKFDALQKSSLQNASITENGKTPIKENSGVEKNCRSCGKVVYKMEEMKAEKNIWHKNCFRCTECNKQLNVDTYQSHESVLYCKPHFKLLFAPKAVEDDKPAVPRKPELIIRENEPEELPPDVVRASDKPDLGLEELHQLDVKSRFQVFEKYQNQQEKIEQEQMNSIEKSSSGVKRSASILSKLAKFQGKGIDTGIASDSLNGLTYEETSSEEEEEDEEPIPEGEDPDLVRAKRMQKERPISLTNMNDIKTKFEKGHIMSKEERREERKQEIQNIRSRLFMGKQARIKEMYQQAVAESEQGVTSSSKKPEIQIGDKAKSIKEKFEKGEIFNQSDDEEEERQHTSSGKVADEERAVFEQGISKKSRSIFMQLDANASKSPQNISLPQTPKTPENRKQPQFSTDNVVKCDEKLDDIKIETSEISSKFKFFETYRPSESKKKEFRITPPRDGVVKMPSPDKEIYIDPDVIKSSDEVIDGTSVAKETHTTTKVLSMFRQMEQKNYDQEQYENGPKPLKRFTPPLDDNRRAYHQNNDSEEDYLDDDEEELTESDEGEEEVEEDDNEENQKEYKYEDEFLKQAQSAARAKQLRAKFEKWEANEIKREMSNTGINIYDNENAEGQTESAKSLRAKFESMREEKKSDYSSSRPKVNRFV